MDPQHFAGKLQYWAARKRMGNYGSTGAEKCPSSLLRV